MLYAHAWAAAHIQQYYEEHNYRIIYKNINIIASTK